MGYETWHAADPFNSHADLFREPGRRRVWRLRRNAGSCPTAQHPFFFDENFFRKEDGWWTRARGRFFEKQDVEWVLFRAAGCPLVPWHAGDEHSHAAPIRGARKDKARANESREPDECRIDKLGQESTGEDEKAGRDAHLALQRDHAGDTPIHWKACRRPCRGSALDHKALFKA